MDFVTRRDLLRFVPVLPTLSVGGLLAACQTGSIPVAANSPTPGGVSDIRLLFSGVLTVHDSVRDKIPASLEAIVENQIAVVRSLDLTNPAEIRAFVLAVSVVVAILTKLPLPPQVMIVLVAVQILLPLVQAGLGMTVDNQSASSVYSASSVMSPEAARNLLKSL